MSLRNLLGLQVIPSLLDQVAMEQGALWLDSFGASAIERPIERRGFFWHPSFGGAARLPASRVSRKPLMRDLLKRYKWSTGNATPQHPEWPDTFFQYATPAESKNAAVAYAALWMSMYPPEPGHVFKLYRHLIKSGQGLTAAQVGPREFVCQYEPVAGQWTNTCGQDVLSGVSFGGVTSPKHWYYFGLTKSPGYGLPGAWEFLGSFTSLFPVTGSDYMVTTTVPFDRYQRIVRGLYNADTQAYEAWVRIAGS